MELRGPNEGMSFDLVVLVVSLLNVWLVGEVWLFSGCLIFEFIQPTIKGLNKKLFERLRRGMLSPEQFINEHSKFLFLTEEWRSVVRDSSVTNYFMIGSVIVAIYDFVFSPWSTWFHMVWAIAFTLPIAYGTLPYVENEKKERIMVNWISQIREGTEGWSLQDRASVTVLLQSQHQPVRMLGKEIDESFGNQYLFFVVTFTM